MNYLKSVVRAQSIVDQIYQSPLLTMEWFCKDVQVHVPQIYLAFHGALWQIQNLCDYF